MSITLIGDCLRFINRDKVYVIYMSIIFGTYYSHSKSQMFVLS